MGSYDPYSFLRRETLENVKWQHVGGAHVDPELLNGGAYYAPVFRYMPGSPEASELIEKRRMRFDHPTRWPDRYEHFVNQELFAREAPFGNMAIYAKCFTFHFAAEAFWRINAGRVRLAFTSLQGLVEALAGADPVGGGVAPKLFVGRVRYMEQSHLRAAILKTQMTPPKAVSSYAAEAVLMKRIGFFHENEIRVFYVGNGPVNEQRSLDIELTDPAPIEDVLIGPYQPPGQEGPLSQHFSYAEVSAAAVKHGIHVSRSAFNLESGRDRRVVV